MQRARGCDAGVPEAVQEPEGEGEESNAQQIPQSGQVRDGRIVWVDAAAPHPVHHAPGKVEQESHLEEGGCQVAGEKDGGDHSVARTQQPDGVHEDHMARQDHQHEEPGGAGVGRLSTEGGARIDAALVVAAGVAAHLRPLGEERRQLA